jgi:putative aminopeptidase FrvX
VAKLERPFELRRFSLLMSRSELFHLLEKLLSLPTAPFHERFVSSFICNELKTAGLDVAVDEYGNIIAAYGDEPSLACVAHMDHPGFEIINASDGDGEASWFGGVDAKYFSGARVVIYDENTGETKARGVVRKIIKNAPSRVEKMFLRLNARVAPGDFGTWDLVPFRRERELIHTKGADDLVGCAAILTMLKEVKKRGSKTGVRGVFTRAEEIGFVGTLGMIRSGALPRSTRIISVETSKALPGVVLGGGPVIRLGDRGSMFDYRMVSFMDHVARELQKNDRRFRFQRRVMDGGTCEATPYQINGYIAGGIAIPLHNYHNQGKTRIGAEAVHLKDFEGAVRLLVEMALRIDGFDVAAQETRARIEGGWEKYGARLKQF